ncbi:uncharacterized protein LOC107264941 isoform X1 [Cephus cinctus]|uniref:Uncharacterized protein LOC107264941 isoform X1 n=1 Tax=Cephus cinctus TaxID=211228 RepID=A0AAJ7FFH5_CEPCN|nr:uncharacterized protein LOC107264941 isoform X1 [Cephus cinctus]
MRSFLIFVTVAVIVISVIQAEYAENNRIEENQLQDTSFNSCKCANNNCGCCEYIDLPRIYINATVCTNITYLPNDYGISMTISYNSDTLFNDTVSVRNPPPICFGEHFIDSLEVDLCIRLHNIDFDKHHLSACVRFEAKVMRCVIAKQEIGCFNIAHQNTQELDVSNRSKTILRKLGFLHEKPIVNMI